MDKPHVTIYTDGGCEPNPGIGGYGVVLIFDDHEQDISGGELESTNNRMELTAAIKALEALNQPYEVDLYTDSEYLKNGITQWINNWIKKNWRNVKNPDLWQQLHEATQRHTIRWHWVKGHAGVEYNERVDQLAMAEIDRLRRSTRPTDENVSQIIIYSHGSCGDLYIGSGGWAVILVAENTIKELKGSEKWSTNNRLALISAIKALEMIESKHEIEFYTDSQYLVDGITRYINSWIKNNWHKSDGTQVKNKELWQQLRQLASGHEIKWKVVDFFGENKYQKRVLELASNARQEVDS